MSQLIKIYVGNIPPSARNSELKELFERYGKVAECDILKEFGFVHMEDRSDAKAAIAGLNDSLWKGSRIRVELSTTKTQKGEPSARKLLSRDKRPKRGRSGDRSRSPPPFDYDRDRRNGRGGAGSSPRRRGGRDSSRDARYNEDSRSRRSPPRRYASPEPYRRSERDYQRDRRDDPPYDHRSYSRHMPPIPHHYLPPPHHHLPPPPPGHYDYYRNGPPPRRFSPEPSARHRYPINFKT
jgi:RNA-binding protein 4